MKFCKIILLLICCQLQVYAQTDSLNFTDKSGLKQGKWKKFHDTGKLRYKGQFKNNKPIGTFYYFDEFGNKTTELTHLNDSTLAIFYHSNGKILSHGTYINQQKNGIWVYYDNNGFLSSTENYQNGKLNGKQTIFYTNGKVSREVNYINNLIQDTVKEYFLDGVLKYKANFVDGNPDSTVYFYHPNGKPSQIGRYKDAVMHGKWTYYNDLGVITRWEFYHLGNLLKTIQREEEPKINNDP